MPNVFDVTDDSAPITGTTVAPIVDPSATPAAPQTALKGLPQGMPMATAFGAAQKKSALDAKMGWYGGLYKQLVDNKYAASPNEAAQLVYDSARAQGLPHEIAQLHASRLSVAASQPDIQAYQADPTGTRALETRRRYGSNIIGGLRDFAGEAESSTAQALAGVSGVLGATNAQKHFADIAQQNAYEQEGQQTIPGARFVGGMVPYVLAPEAAAAPAAGVLMGGQSAQQAFDAGHGRGAATIAGVVGGATGAVLPGVTGQFTGRIAAPLARPGTVMGQAAEGVGAGAGLAGSQVASGLSIGDTEMAQQGVDSGPEQMGAMGVLTPLMAAFRRGAPPKPVSVAKTHAGDTVHVEEAPLPPQMAPPPPMDAAPQQPIVAPTKEGGGTIAATGQPVVDPKIAPVDRPGIAAHETAERATMDQLAAQGAPVEEQYNKGHDAGNTAEDTVVAAQGMDPKSHQARVAGDMAQIEKQGVEPAGMDERPAMVNAKEGSKTLAQGESDVPQPNVTGVQAPDQRVNATTRTSESEGQTGRGREVAQGQDATASREQVRPAAEGPTIPNNEGQPSPVLGEDEPVMAGRMWNPSTKKWEAPSKLAHLKPETRKWVESQSPEVRKAIQPDVEHLRANPDPVGELGNLKMSADSAVRKAVKAKAVEAPVAVAPPEEIEVTPGMKRAAKKEIVERVDAGEDKLKVIKEVADKLGVPADKLIVMSPRERQVLSRSRKAKVTPAAEAPTKDIPPRLSELSKDLERTDLSDKDRKSIDDEIGRLTGEGIEPREHKAGPLNADMYSGIPVDPGKLKKAYNWFMYGGVPKEMRRVVEEHGARGNALASQYTKVVNDLKDALKSPGDKDLAQKYWADPSTPIPADKEYVAQAVDNIRPEFRELSKQIKELPGISDELAASIDENMGTYMRRRFASNEPTLGAAHQKWVDQNPRVVDAAMAELKDSGLSEADARNTISDMLNVWQTKGAGAGPGGPKDSNDPSILKQRLELGPAVRRLKGEMVNPVANAADTAAKMISLIAQRHLQTDIVDKFNGTLIHENVPEGATGMVKTTMHDGKEYYTTPEIKKFLESPTSTLNYETWGRVLPTIGRIAKMSAFEFSTTASTFSQVFGNILVAMKSGHLVDLAHPFEGLNKLKAITKWSGKDSTDYRAELIRNKVFGSDSGDLNQLAHMARMADKSSVLQWLDHMVKAPRKIVGYADTLTKVNAYEMEKQRIQRTNPELSAEEVGKMAGERVADEYTTFSRQAQATKLAAANPFAGFSGFVSEQPRNFSNAARNAVLDAKKDPVGSGLKMLGLASAIFATSALQAYSKWSNNVTDQEDESFRALNKFSKYDKLMYSRDDKGKLTAVCLGRYDPLNMFQSAMSAAMDSRAEPDERLIEALSAIASPYVGGGPAKRVVTDAMKPGLYPGERIGKAAWALAPSAIRHGINAVAADTPEDRKRETIAALTGYAPIGAKPEMNLTFAAKDINDEASKAVGYVHRQAFKAGGMTPELQKQLNDIEDKRRTDMIQLSNDARNTGVSQDEITRTLGEQAGIHKLADVGETMLGNEAKDTPPEVGVALSKLTDLRRKGAPELDVGLTFNALKGQDKATFLEDNEYAVRKGVRQAALYNVAQKLLSLASRQPPEKQAALVARANQIVERIKVLQGTPAK